VRAENLEFNKEGKRETYLPEQTGLIKATESGRIPLRGPWFLNFTADKIQNSTRMERCESANHRKNGSARAPLRKTVGLS
jgi:hypothetical protein